MLGTLQNRSYRLFVANCLLNDVAQVAFIVSQGWLTLSITGSALWVGAVGGAYGAGLLVFSALGGVLADRLNRKRLLAMAQASEATVAVALGVLIATDLITVWHMVAGAVVFGASTSVGLPTRHTLILDLLGRARLLKGIAASFACKQVAAIVAPLVAGSMLDSVNPSWVYAFIAIAGAFAIVSLLPVKYVKAKVEEQHAPLRELREGLVYVLKTPMVRTLLLLALVTEMFGWSHEFLLPVMAEDILEVGASGLGYLLSTAAAGAVVATLAVSSVRDIRRRGRVLVLGAMGFGLVLVAFSFSRWFPLSLVLLALAYGAAVSYETVLSTVIQTSVPSGMRGRVSSLQTATWGLTGVGGFVMGAIGSVLTVPIAIAIGGGLVAVNAARMLPMTSRFDARKAEQPASSTSPAL